MSQFCETMTISCRLSHHFYKTSTTVYSRPYKYKVAKKQLPLVCGSNQGSGIFFILYRFVLY